jgi:hypothetical protein
MGKRHSSQYIDGMTGVVHCGGDILSTYTCRRVFAIILPELCFVSFFSLCLIVAAFQLFGFCYHGSFGSQRGCPLADI